MTVVQSSQYVDRELRRRAQERALLGGGDYLNRALAVKAMAMRPDVPEVDADDLRSVGGGVWRSLVRDAVLGPLEGIVRTPATIAQAMGASESGRLQSPAVVPALGDVSVAFNQFLHFAIAKKFDEAADVVGMLRNHSALAADPRSVVEGVSAASFVEAVNNPRWWSDQFPGLAGNAVTLLLPGMAVSRTARLSGVAVKEAQALGYATSSALLFAAETGSSAQAMRDDLVSKGVPFDEATVIAGRGGLAYGMVAGLIERGILPYEFASGGSGSALRRYVLRILAAGTGEITEEETQLLTEGITRVVIGRAAGTSLDHGVTPRAMFESAVAAAGGAGALTIPTVNPPRPVDRARSRIAEEAAAAPDEAAVQDELQIAQEALAAFSPGTPVADLEFPDPPEPFSIIGVEVEAADEFPDDLTVLPPAERDEAAEYVQQMVATGVDPDTGIPLTDDEQIRVTAIAARLEQVATDEVVQVEQVDEDALEAEAIRAEQLEQEQVDGEEETDVEADTVAETGRDPERADAEAGGQQAAEEEREQPKAARVTLKSLTETVAAEVASGPGTAIDQVNAMIALHLQGEGAADVAGLPVEAMAVTAPPTGLPPREPGRVTTDLLGRNLSETEPRTGEQGSLLAEPSPLEQDELDRRAAVRERLEKDESGDLLDSLETGADSVAEAARQRMKNRRRPGRGPGGLRGGSAPIFEDVADASIIVAARAFALGIRGARSIRKLADTVVRQFMPHLLPHVGKVAGNARRIVVASSDEAGNRDDDKFEQAANQVRTRAAARAARVEGSIKQRIRDAIRGERGEASVRPSDALRANLEGQQRAARNAAVEQKRESGRAARAELKRRLTRLRQRLAAKQEAVDGIRAELVDIVRQHLPPAVRGKLLTEVRDASTIGTLARGIRRVRAELLEHERQEAINALRQTIQDVNPDRLRPQFRDQVKALIGDVGLKKLSGQVRSRLEGLAAFMAANPDAQIPARHIEQLGRLSQRPIADLTTDEALTLNEAVLHFVKLNELFGRIVRKRRADSLQRVAGQAAREISGTLGTRGKDTAGKPLPPKQHYWWQLPLTAEGNLKLETLTEFISGAEDTTTVSVFYQELFDAYNEWLGGFQSAMDQFTTILESEGVAPGTPELANMSTSLSRERGLVGSLASKGTTKLSRETLAERVDVAITGGRVLKMTRGVRMFMLASFQDAETLEIILDGNPVRLTDDAVGETFVLTADDVRMIEDSADAVETRIVMRSLEIVNGQLKDEVRAWSVDTLGYDITRPDTYWMRHRDQPKASGDAFQGARFGQATLRSASLAQERTGGSQPIQMRDFFVEFINASWSTYAVSRMETPLRTARQVLESDDVSAAMRNSPRGGKLVKHFTDIFDEVARTAVGGPTIKGPVTTAVSQAVNKLTVGLLAANPRVIMYQPVSIITASTEMPWRYLVRAMRDSFNFAVDERIKAGSPWLRARFEAAALALINEAGGGGQRVLGFAPGRTKVDTAAEFFMRGIQFMDRVAIRTIYRAAELQVAREHPGLSAEEAAERAARIAEKVVRRTQPVFDVLHLSGIGLEGRKNAAVKATTMFFSQRNQNVNILARAVMRARRDPSRANLRRQASVFFSATVGQGLGIVAAKELWEWILGGFKDEDDDESWTQRWGSKLTDATVGNFYYSDVVNLAIKKIMFQSRAYGSDMSPFIGNVTDFFHGMIRAANGVREGDARFWSGSEDMMVAAGALSGVPIIAPYRMMRRAIDNVMDDDVKNQQFNPR